MAWDYSDTFKGLIAGAIGWIATKAVKKLNPAYKALLKFLRVAKKADEIHITTNVLKSSLVALYHVDKDPIFLLNKNGELTYCNPAWVELTGMEQNDAKGYGYSRAIHPDDRDRMDKERTDIINHPAPFFGTVKFKHMKTGEMIVVICRTELIYNGTELVETLGRLYIIK